MLYPLVQAGTAQRSVWFNPYPAQFRTPVHPDDMPFDVSVAIGEQLLRSHIAQVHAQCPAAAIVLVGYSQGATVAGDVAATSLIPIRETELLADPRRVPAMAHDVGPSPDGVGVEVFFNGSVYPGITLTGPRIPFHSAVNEICAPRDAICDSTDLSLASDPRKAVADNVHVSYRTTRFWSAGGLSAVQWLLHRIQLL